MVTPGSQVHINNKIRRKDCSMIDEFNLLWYPMIEAGLSQNTTAR